MSETFRIGLTADFRKSDGTLGFAEVATALFDAAPGVEWVVFDEDRPELGPDQVRGCDALLVLAPWVTAATLAGADRLAIVARWGVGYDSVDVPACSENGVLVTITPDGVRRPVATSVVAYVLALSLRLVEKDRLTRAGGWGQKNDYLGTGLVGRTLGLIGLGNIGRETLALTRPFGMRHLAYDPYLTAEQGSQAGAELVDLATLLRESDFVTINCALTPETHHLLDAERLALMKPTAYLVNTARGPIVDQRALATALRGGGLRGAALDVFEQEPVDPDDPILQLDNVLVAPHAICWTDQCFEDIGRSAGTSILDVAAGRVPRFVVNRDVLERPGLRAARQRQATRAE